MNWYDHICEYFNVTSEEALKLGTRGKGRKPDLPSSDTCKSVTNMSYEDIWDSDNRSTLEGVFKFYKDQGSWSTFRQCVRHKDMTSFHLGVLGNVLKDGSNFCEYGCGVAPFSTSLLSYIDKNVSLNIFISDVDCEHFNFAQWRLNKIIKERNLKNVNVYAHEVKHDKLPEYSKKIDCAIIFEVLEHVPSPIDTTSNIINQLTTGGYFIENFIKHEDHDEDDGSDLASAKLERSGYYTLLNEKMNLVTGNPEQTAHNQTRIWQKK